VSAEEPSDPPQFREYCRQTLPWDYFLLARHPLARLASAEFPISDTVPRRSQRDFSCSFKGVQPGTVVLGDGDVNRLVLSANLVSCLGSLQAAAPM
jgi:hypothetical protein